MKNIYSMVYILIHAYSARVRECDGEYGVYSARITPLSIDQVSRMTTLCIIYMLHTCLI